MYTYICIEYSLRTIPTRHLRIVILSVLLIYWTNLVLDNTWPIRSIRIPNRNVYHTTRFKSKIRLGISKRFEIKDIMITRKKITNLSRVTCMIKYDRYNANFTPSICTYFADVVWIFTFVN